MPTKQEVSVQHAIRSFKTMIVAAVTSLGVLGLSLISGCSTDVSKVKSGYSSQEWPALPEITANTAPKVSESSLAHSAKEYRKDAASHLYGINKERIFKGRMPPMLQAVGVLDVDIDRQGQVKALNWKRPPKHAPQVMAEIEHMVKAAAPYPAPKNLSQVTYTDVWLWHKSGKFQLDTLTEGQD
jgi:periplasmic protein TonB